ncbi:MAG: RluA family pseudouridine synthase [Anaerolineae bacterium]
MAEPRIVELTARQGGERLDKFLAAGLQGVSRTEIQRLIKEAQVLVNGREARPSYRLEAGDVVCVALPLRPDDVVRPQDIPLEVLYEDADLVAVNKPPGMVVHPAQGSREDTLVNAALWRWPEMAAVGGPDRAGVVHRLDKETSGVILLARTPAALAALQAQFKARTTTKQYLALVEGIPVSRAGVIEAPIGRDPRQRKRMAVVHEGRPSVTRYDVIEVFDEHALLAVEPKTGRTHQIRVHLAWLGHPVVGDRVYGFRRQRLKIGRMFLHAAALEVVSPSTGERLRFEAPLPPDLADVLSRLRGTRADQWVE